MGTRAKCRFFWALVGLLGMAACTTDRPLTGVLESEFDPFADENLVVIDDMQVTSGQGPIAVRIVGRPADPRWLEFILSTSSSSWLYLTCHDVELRADRRPLRLGRAAYGKKIREADVYEQIRFMVARSEVEDFGRSRAAEGRICKTRFRFTDEQKKKILMLVERVVVPVKGGAVPIPAPSPTPPATATESSVEPKVSR
jgi:hypothetical protein